MSRRDDRAKAVLEEQQKELDKVTRLLCYLCRHIEDYEGVGIHISYNEELKTWWNAHKEAERGRPLGGKF